MLLQKFCRFVAKHEKKFAEAKIFWDEVEKCVAVATLLSRFVTPDQMKERCLWLIGRTKMLRNIFKMSDEPLQSLLTQNFRNRYDTIWLLIIVFNVNNIYFAM